MIDKGLYQSFKSMITKRQKEENVGVEDAPEKVVTNTVIKRFKVEERISVEIIYEPNVLDAHGEWMSEDTLAKACENFNKNLASGNAKPNLFHIKDETDKLEILRTYTLPCECTIGNTLVKQGTWVAEIKWHDKALWKQRTVPDENGVLAIAGTSIGALGRKATPQEDVDG
jgi:phosphoribosylformylglycinamidine (FGAM) synthase PurS component